MDTLQSIILMVVVLLIGGVFGFFIAPEYISLEQMQTDSFEAQLEAKDVLLDQTVEYWEFECESNKQFQIEMCAKEKSELVERLSERNAELIADNKELSEGWQEAFEDLNATILVGLQDLNKAIFDLNYS